MKASHHRLLWTYTVLFVLLVFMFVFVVYFGQPSFGDVLSMMTSIALFALIPAGILVLIWKHHKD